MCVIAAKWFPEIGWVGIKQRDRNYTPKLTSENIPGRNGGDVTLYVDEMTGYREGLNSDSVGILSASLKVADDEKEIEKSSDKHSGDGDRIEKALSKGNLKDAVKTCIKEKLTGNTIIFDKDRLFLLEACTKPCREGEKEEGEYEFKLKEIPKTETVARTNHGVDLSWAGYQNTGETNERMSRKSSESRLKIARAIVKKAKTPKLMLDLLCKEYSKDSQMNTLRKVSGNKKMRTTAQIAIVPSEAAMYIRPIDTRIDKNIEISSQPELRLLPKKSLEKGG
jgi:hypothetical protein